MKNGPPPPNSAISLPFIIVHTDKDTYIDCSISTDKCVHSCIIVFTYGTDEACMSTLNVFVLLCVCTPVWLLRDGGDRRLYQDVYCVYVCVHVGMRACNTCLYTYTPTSMLYYTSCCRSEYVFHFDQPFAIHDDLDVLKKMGMAFGLELGTCSAEDLQRAKALLPKAFETFLTSEHVRQTLSFARRQHATCNVQYVEI